VSQKTGHDESHDLFFVWSCFSFHLTEFLRPRQAEAIAIASNKPNHNRLNPTPASGVNDGESNATNVGEWAS